jgi:transcriptional regulator with XRE-family HTH domain
VNRNRDRDTLGEIIRRQREMAELSMRQFAEQVGISNPYLSQIERGLREPSERVLDAIANALRTSADMLYEQAGVIPPSRMRQDEPATVQAIRSDPDLTPRQRSALMEVYDAFTGRRRPPRRAGRGPAHHPPAAEPHGEDEVS